MIHQNLSTLRKLMLLKGATGGSKAIEATATGNPLTFQTDLAKPLKSLLIPFTPQQEGSGDPSPSNIRSILPWNGLKVFGGGKNLLNPVAENAFAYSTYTHYSLSDGVMTVDGGVLMGFKVRCKPLTTYTFSIKSTKNSYDLHLRVYASENEPTEFVAQNTRLNEQQNLYGSFTTQANDNWLLVGVYVAPDLGREGLTISDLQLEVGQTATAYEPYRPITETDISFPSPVYGGTLDVMSGVMTDKYADGELVAVGKQGNFFYTTLYSLGLPNIASINKGLVCDRLQNNANTSEVTTEPSITVYANGIVRFVVPDYIESTWQEFNEATKNDRFKFAYEVAEPQEIQLTPSQITALVGDNTIWSDADGQMTAVYLKKG